MEKKYIVGLVATAVVITALLGFFVYKNWASVTEIFKKSVNTIGDKFKKIKPNPPVKKSPEVILEQAEEDPLLTQDLIKLNKEMIDSKNKTKDIVSNTEIIMKQESSQKKKKSGPLASIIAAATKYRKIADEKKASEEYDAILRKIESEKAKAAVLLTATKAETQKADKLKIMQSLDMEEEEYGGPVNSRMTPFGVITKTDGEIFIAKQRTTV
jgi:cytoskeletal protein RodZ